jgi:3-phosphoshikimate 1-carboxyvinyltransferase
MGDLVDALRALGVTVEEEGEPGHLPLTVTGPITGDEVTVPGTISSQYTSGLLLAGGARPGGLAVDLGTERLVSAPYVVMTAHVSAAFGVPVGDLVPGWRTWGGGYRATEYAVEADAATAAYLLTAAAITGGTVTVPDMPSTALHADAELVDVLEAMGGTVTRVGGDVTVAGPAGGRLRGGTFDLTAFSDMAPTVAVLGAFADGPVEVTGVGFIRGKETDRIAASVEQLRNIGVDAEETPDGFVVRPGTTPHGAVIETYDDHRMAMSFALVGLVVPGISVADPGVVAKTHPGFWADLERLRG